MASAANGNTPIIHQSYVPQTAQHADAGNVNTGSNDKINDKVGRQRAESLPTSVKPPTTEQPQKLSLMGISIFSRRGSEPSKPFNFGQTFKDAIQGLKEFALNSVRGISDSLAKLKASGSEDADTTTEFHVLTDSDNLDIYSNPAESTSTPEARENSQPKFSSVSHSPNAERTGISIGANRSKQAQSVKEDMDIIKTILPKDSNDFPDNPEVLGNQLHQMKSMDKSFEKSIKTLERSETGNTPLLKEAKALQAELKLGIVQAEQQLNILNKPSYDALINQVKTSENDSELEELGNKLKEAISNSSDNAYKTNMGNVLEEVNLRRADLFIKSQEN